MRRSDRDGFFAPPEEERGRRSAVLRALVFTVVLTGAIGGLFAGGEYVQRYVTYRRERVELHAMPDRPPQVDAGPEVPWTEPLRHMILESFYALPKPGRSEELLSIGFPVYDLRIRPEHLLELRNVAEKVTARRFSAGLDIDYVPARFLWDGRWRRVDVRVRGATSMHYMRDRPSLRIRFPPGRFFEGKRWINVIDPYDKGLTADVTACWELSRRGLLTWDNRFVVLRVNDDVSGFFQEIEQFGPSIPMGSGRPEGPLFGGWKQVYGRDDPRFDKAIRAMDVVDSLYEASQDRAAPPCDWEVVDRLFDTDRMAWAAAYINLVGYHHGWTRNNIRFYFDPIRGTFEPVPWDYHFARLDPESPLAGEVTPYHYAALFLKIPEFRRMRDERLWTLLNTRVDALIGHADSLFEALEPALRSDWRHPDFERDVRYHGSYIATLRHNRDLLFDLYGRHEIAATVSRTSAGAARLAVENLGRAPIAIRGAVLAHEGKADTLRLDGDVVIAGAWIGRTETARIDLEIPAEAGIARIIGIVARDALSGKPIDPAAVRIVAGEVAGGVPGAAEPWRAPAIEGVVRDGDRLVFGPGRVVLEETLELPRGIDVVFLPGLELDVSAETSLIVRGDLTSEGWPERPVRVMGRLGARGGGIGAGGATAWGCIAVQGRRTDPVNVRLRHTVVTGGRGGETDRVYFDGSLAIHDGIVEIRDCRFSRTEGRAAVSLKYVEAAIEENRFDAPDGDGLEIDYSTGRVAGNTFDGAGRHGISMDGSELEIEGNVATGCGAEAIVLAAGSRGRIRDGYIAGGPAGIAVKSGSDAEIAGCGFARLGSAVIVAAEDPAFPPPEARVAGLALYDVATPFTRGPGCRFETAPSTRYTDSPVHDGGPSVRHAGEAPERSGSPFADFAIVPAPAGLDGHEGIRRILSADPASGRPHGIGAAIDWPLRQ
jgi:hypothetical protein